MPRLADRSVVIKPVDPIYIPAGQRGTFISVRPYGLQAWFRGLTEPFI